MPGLNYKTYEEVLKLEPSPEFYQGLGVYTLLLDLETVFARYEKAHALEDAAGKVGLEITNYNTLTMRWPYRLTDTATNDEINKCLAFVHNTWVRICEWRKV